MTTIAIPNRTSRTRSAAISVTTTTATTTPTWIQRSAAASMPGRLPDERDRPDVPRIDEAGPGARLDDGDVVEPDLDPADEQADRRRSRGPRRSPPAEDAGVRPAALAPGPDGDPQEERRRVELGDGRDGDRDATRDLRPPRGLRPARRAAAGRTRADTRRRGCRTARRSRTAGRAARWRSRGPPSGAAGRPALTASRAATSPNPSVAPTRPQHQHDAVGEPRDQRHRLGDRRRVRVEELDGVGRRTREHRGVVRALAGEDVPRALEQQREVEARLGRVALEQGPADPRDAGPRDDAGDHPGAEAVGVEPSPAGRGGRARCGRHGGTIRGRGRVSSRVEGVPG